MIFVLTTTIKNHFKFQLMMMNEKMDGRKKEVICQTNRVNLFLSVKNLFKKFDARNVLKILKTKKINKCIIVVQNALLSPKITINL